MVDGATLMDGFFESTPDKLLHITGKLASRVCHLVFGKLDERAVHRGDLRLAKDISHEWAGLLQEHSGQVQVSSAHRRSSFDYAMVRVVFPEVLFEVTRGRGELRVRISPKSEPNQLEDLSILIRSLDGEGIQQVRADMTLAQLCSVLTDHWKAVAANR